MTERKIQKYFNNWLNDHNKDLYIYKLLNFMINMI